MNPRGRGSYLKKKGKNMELDFFNGNDLWLIPIIMLAVTQGDNNLPEDLLASLNEEQLKRYAELVEKFNELQELEDKKLLG